MSYGVSSACRWISYLRTHRIVFSALFALSKVREITVFVPNTLSDACYFFFRRKVFQSIRETKGRVCLVLPRDTIGKFGKLSKIYLTPVLSY